MRRGRSETIATKRSAGARCRRIAHSGRIVARVPGRERPEPVRTPAFARSTWRRLRCTGRADENVRGSLRWHKEPAGAACSRSSRCVSMSAVLIKVFSFTWCASPVTRCRVMSLRNAPVKFVCERYEKRSSFFRYIMCASRISTCLPDVSSTSLHQTSSTHFQARDSAFALVRPS
jgi:hypothetical protein